MVTMAIGVNTVAELVVRLMMVMLLVMIAMVLVMVVITMITHGEASKHRDKKQHNTGLHDEFL